MGTQSKPRAIEAALDFRRRVRTQLLANVYLNMLASATPPVPRGECPPPTPTPAYLPETLVEVAARLGVHAKALSPYLCGNRGHPDTWGRDGGKVTKLAILRVVLPPGELCPACKLPREYHVDGRYLRTGPGDGVRREGKQPIYCDTLASYIERYQSAVSVLRDVGYLPREEG